MLFSVFIPPGYPVQIYIHVGAILQDLVARFKRSYRMIDSRPITSGTADRLGHRSSRNEGGSCCAFSTYRRGDLAKSRQ